MKFTKFLLPCLIIFTLSALSFKCTQDVAERVELPETLLVSKVDYDKFYSDLILFSEELNSDQTKQLDNYADDLKTLNSQSGRIADAVCNCLAGQTTCAAAGAFSECCICCANGVSAVCGTIIGFASCRCNDPQEPGIGGRGASPSEFVTIYPKRIDELFNYSNLNKINVSKIRKSFELLVEGYN